MTEIYKDIPGYEGLYQVSDLGNVRNTKRENILKPHVDKDGRVSIQLSKNGNRKTTRVCRLVALGFIGEKPKGYHVCHNDGNARNNELINIRYDTPTENSIDFYRYGSKTANGILTIEQVLEIRKLYNINKYTQQRLSMMFKVSQRTISNIVNKMTFQWLNEDGTISQSKTEVS